VSATLGTETLLDESVVQPVIKTASHTQIITAEKASIIHSVRQNMTAGSVIETQNSKHSRCGEVVWKTGDF
jgi:hypothetical protein